MKLGFDEVRSAYVGIIFIVQFTFMSGMQKKSLF